MKPELSIVKSFLTYKNWEQHASKLTANDFPEELKLLYRTLHSFHSSNTDGVDLQLLDLANLFFANRPADREFYESLFETLKDYEPQEDTVSTLITSIHRAKVLRDLSIAAYEVAEGKADSAKVDQLVAEYATPTADEDDDDVFVTTDLEELVNETTAKPGLTWRLNALNRSLGSLRKGDFGFVFARPETGKTTFLASEISEMLRQIRDNDGGAILWFNNEEQGSKVMLRIIQAYFGVTLEQLYSNLQGYKEAFNREVGVLLKLVDAATIDRNTVERIVRKTNPSLIIFDQLDKLQGFDGDREDLHLGKIYIWARELAKQWAPVIGVSQADGTGEGVSWLTMAHVANAKTAKQAEADWILGIGKVNTTGYENVRYLNISKNKLAGDMGVTDPKLRHGKMQVLIDAQVARYKDIE